MAAIPRRHWFRFTLRSLLIGVLLAGSAQMLRSRWGPWEVERTWNLAPEPGYGHLKPLCSVGFSPDGKRLFTLWGEAELPPDVGYAVGDQPRHTAWQTTVPATLRMYDSETGKMLWEYVDAGTAVDRAIAWFSPEGKWIRFARELERINPDRGGFEEWDERIFNTETGARPVLPPSLISAARASMERPLAEQPFNSATDNPLNDGPLTGSILFANDSLLAIKWEQNLYVFDPKMGKEISVLHGTDRDVMKPIAFSEDNKLIVVTVIGATTETSEINRVYDVATGTVSQSPSVKDLDAMATAARASSFVDIGLLMESSLDHPYRVLGTNLVLSAENVNGKFAVKIENAESKTTTYLPAQYRKVPYAHVARGGKRIVVASLDGVTQVWRLSRPDAWWGVAWLPEFWLTAFLSGALAWSLWRERRKVQLRAV